ncbi:MAG: metallophosphoesterase family protein [Deltaproteobacteria bacterium]|nr:metallophosphoesterase family protein [Deltaproteobacteria bacterium]
MKEYIVGLISDTHGLLRHDAFDFLKGCDAIIHAGDICNDNIITQLSTIAPVHAVRGNMDFNATYPASDLLTIGKNTFYILHDLEKLDLDLQTAGVDVVVFGHSHQPESFRRNDVLYINPGSAGPKRRDRPISLARLHLKNNCLIPDFIELGA